MLVASRRADRQPKRRLTRCRIGRRRPVFTQRCNKHPSADDCKHKSKYKTHSIPPKNNLTMQRGIRHLRIRYAASHNMSTCLSYLSPVNDTVIGSVAVLTV
jgi:hypothetical protein